MNPHLFESSDETQVLLQEALTHHRHSFRVGHPNPVNVFGLDTFVFQQLVDLGTGPVEDNRVQANVVKEGETQGKLGQLVGDNGTTNLDHGKLLLQDRGEVLEVLFDLALQPNVIEELDHGGTGQVSGDSVAGGRLSYDSRQRHLRESGLREPSQRPSRPGHLSNHGDSDGEKLILPIGQHFFG